MTYQLTFTREFKKNFDKLDKAVKERVRTAVERLQKNPELGKRLTGILVDRWSYRVGDYRVLYKVFHEKITVLLLTVGHRRDVYRG